MSLQGWLRDSANAMEKSFRMIFGKIATPDAVRAYGLFFLFSTFLLYLLGLVEEVEYLLRPPSMVLIPAMIAYLSFEVTRYLITQIVRRNKLKITLLLWSIDLFACWLILAMSNVMANLFWPSKHTAYFSLNVEWFQQHPFIREILLVDLVYYHSSSWIEVHSFTVSLVPHVISSTLFHIAFVTAIGAAYLAEMLRRVFALILDRIDESGSSPVTSIVAVLSSISAVIVAVIGYLKSIGR